MRTIQLYMYIIWFSTVNIHSAQFVSRTLHRAVCGCNVSRRPDTWRIVGSNSIAARFYPLFVLSCASKLLATGRSPSKVSYQTPASENKKHGRGWLCSTIVWRLSRTCDSEGNNIQRDVLQPRIASCRCRLEQTKYWRKPNGISKWRESRFSAGRSSVTQACILHLQNRTIFFPYIWAEVCWQFIEWHYNYRSILLEQGETELAKYRQALRYRQHTVFISVSTKPLVVAQRQNV